MNFLKHNLEFSFLIFIFAILFFLPKIAPAYITILTSHVLIYAVIAISWSIFSGPTGYISLAPAAFFGIGVYTSAMLSFKLPLLVIAGLAAALSFIVALPVGSLTLRLKGIYFSIFTFGLVEFLRHFVLWWETTFSKTRGRIVKVVDHEQVFYSIFIVLVCLLIFAFLLKKSRFQLALEAIGEDETAAAHSGVDLNKTKIIFFALSSSFVGASGSIMAMKLTYVDPYIAFNVNYSFLPILMAMIGGVRIFFGPLLGSFFLGVLEEQLVAIFPYYSMIILGVILILTVMYLPNGILLPMTTIITRWIKRIK